MDLKRYEQITSEEALEVMAKQGWVFDINERQYSIQDGKFKVKDKYVVDALMGMSLNEFLAKEWYVKKPFDVRAEMLARPNEWVAAFEGDDGKWHKVGFDTKYMRGIETPFLSVEKVDFEQAPVGLLTYEETEKCIPIEDIPKEEWS